MERITVQELHKQIGNIEIIDIRESCELDSGSIPTSKHIPATGLLYNYEFLLDKQKTYYITCFSGGRSFSIVRHLEGLGYSAVNVVGGTFAYSQNFKLEYSKC